MFESFTNTKTISNNRYQNNNIENLNILNNNDIKKGNNTIINNKANKTENLNFSNLYHRKKICLFYKTKLDPNKITNKKFKRYTKKVFKSKSIIKDRCQKLTQNSSDLSLNNVFINNLRQNSNFFNKTVNNNNSVKEDNEKNFETDVNEIITDKTEDKVQVHVPNLSGFMKGGIGNWGFYKNELKNENIFNNKTFYFLNNNNHKNLMNSNDLKYKKASVEKKLIQREKNLALNNTTSSKINRINLLSKKITNTNDVFKAGNIIKSYDEVVKKLDYKSNPNIEKINIITDNNENTLPSKDYSFLKKLNFDQPFRCSEKYSEHKIIINNSNIKIPNHLNNKKFELTKTNNNKKHIITHENNKNRENINLLGSNYKKINRINFKNIKKIDIFNISNDNNSNLNSDSNRVDVSYNANNDNNTINNCSDNNNGFSSDGSTEKEDFDVCKNFSHLMNYNKYKSSKIQLSKNGKQNSSFIIFENQKTINNSNKFEEARSFSTSKKKNINYENKNIISLNYNISNPINHIYTRINCIQPKTYFSNFRNNFYIFLFDLNNIKFKLLIEDFLDLKSIINLSSINRNFFNKMRNVFYNKFYDKIILQENTNVFKNKFIKKIMKSLLNYSSEKIRNLKAEKLSDVYKAYNYKSRYNDYIIKDLTRTFPDDETFNKNSLNYYKLYNILTTYSNFNKQIGYAQGLNFISAIGLYLFDTEEEVFVFLDGLINRFELNNYIGIKNSKLINKISFFSEILNKYVPEVINFFNKNSLTHEFFSIGWNLTLFSNCMEKRCLIVIWSFMVIFGWKFFYCFAIELLIHYKDDIINTNTKLISKKMKNLVCNEAFVHNFRKIIGETFKLMKNKIVL